VDQVIFVAQAGTNQAEHICEAIELFGKEVIPRFEDRLDASDAEKERRLEGATTAALARRSPPRRATAGYLVTPQAEPHPAPGHAPTGGGREAGNSASGGGTTSLRARASAWLQGRGEAAFGRFVRGRTDDQLIRTVGTSLGLRMIFRGMERNFHPERTMGFAGDLQYVLTAGSRERPWVIHIDVERIAAEPGRAADPAVTLRMSVPTFARIVTRLVPPAQAFMDGRIGIEGDFQVASRMGQWFGDPSPF